MQKLFQSILFELVVYVLICWGLTMTMKGAVKHMKCLLWRGLLCRAFFTYNKASLVHFHSLLAQSFFLAI